MSTARLAAVAIVAGLSARTGWPVHPWGVAGLMVAAVAAVTVVGVAPAHWRRAVAVLGVVLLCCAVGARGASERRSLDAAGSSPRMLEGPARLVTDPEVSAVGAHAVVHVDGRRYWLRVPSSQSAVLVGLLAGDHVQVAGRTGPLTGSDAAWRWSRHLAGVLQVERLESGPPANWWMGAANAVRRNLQRGLAGLDAPTAALAAGLVVGDDRDQDDLDRFRFRASGLGHLLAVSGQNVALTLAAVAPLLRRVPLRWRWVAGSVVVAAFVVVTRAEPSVLRAAAMATVALVASSAGRPLDGVRGVALSVIVLLVVDPLLVHAVGFQLSVAATVGLAVASGPLAGRLRGPGWFREQVAASLAASVATLPLQVATFGVVPVVGVVANVLAVPVAGLVVTAGPVLGSVAGVLRGDLGRVIVWPVGVLVGWIDAVAVWSSRVPFGPLGVSGVVGIGAALGLVAASMWTAVPGDRWRATRWCAAGVAAAVVVAALVPRSVGTGSHRLTSAASLVVDDGGRRTVRCAAGADPLDVLDGLWRLGVHRVDEVVAPGGSSAAAAVAEHHRTGPVTAQG